MRIFTLFVLLLFVQLVKCQEINNKINLYIGYGIGGFQGKEVITEGNFISPSIYANFNYSNGISFKGLVKRGAFYSLGMGFDYLNASNWENLNYKDYLNSGIKQYSLSPIVQFHNKFKSTGIFNRIKVVCEIGPTIGLSNLKLVNPLFDIQSESSSVVSQPMKSNDLFFGVKGCTGIELTINRSVGLYFTYSLQNGWVKSNLYPDKHFTCSMLGMGIFLRFKRDKSNFY